MKPTTRPRSFFPFFQNCSKSNIFYFHPDHLGSSNYITNLNGNISQHDLSLSFCGMEYLPFGESLVEEHKNSNNSPYKFNGKELDEETGNYYYGARYYDPKFSMWLSVDPMAEKYPGWSSYNYTLNNPINLTDPDGRSVEWKPKLNDDGSTTYIKEAGDNQATLKSQYGLSDETASKLYSSMDKNGEISGQSVYNTKPYKKRSEVLKLDLNSKQATDQRKFDQYVYGRDRTASRGGYAFLSTDYYSHTKYKNVLRGFAHMCINGENIKLHFDIPVYRPGTFHGSPSVGIGVYPFTTKQNGGSLFGSKQQLARFPIYHPDTGNRMGGFDIYAKGHDTDKIYDRFHQKPNRYHYINTNNNFKN